jgi:hypothetical protein
MSPRPKDPSAMERSETLQAARTEAFRVPLPPGPDGLEVGLAILDLLEDRFGAELIDFDLRDQGGSFTVRLPQKPARPGTAA